MDLEHSLLLGLALTVGSGHRVQAIVSKTNVGDDNAVHLSLDVSDQLRVLAVGDHLLATCPAKTRVNTTSPAVS